MMKGGEDGTRPDKNCVMLSLKFPRQKIVKGDFLNRDGDFRAWGRKVGGKMVPVHFQLNVYTRLYYGDFEWRESGFWILDSGLLILSHPILASVEILRFILYDVTYVHTQIHTHSLSHAHTHAPFIHSDHFLRSGAQINKPHNSMSPSIHPSIPPSLCVCVCECAIWF